MAGPPGITRSCAPTLRTDLAERDLRPPSVNLYQYPAHLHIGLLPDWRRKGIGTALMTAFADYLHAMGIPGYHLYVSSFHPLGLAFYRKLGLDDLGQFDWRLHTGYKWITVTESVFGKNLLHFD
jgi:GNAT superfamily N-acetyltransferase